MYTILEAKDIKTKKLPGIGRDIPTWIAIQFPNGNTLHNVRRRYSGGRQYYESDNYAFGVEYDTMAKVKKHAASVWNSRVG